MSTCINQSRAPTARAHRVPTIGPAVLHRAARSSLPVEGRGGLAPPPPPPDCLSVAEPLIWDPRASAFSSRRCAIVCARLGPPRSVAGGLLPAGPLALIVAGLNSQAQICRRRSRFGRLGGSHVGHCRRRQRRYMKPVFYGAGRQRRRRPWVRCDAKGRRGPASADPAPKVPRGRVKIVRPRRALSSVNSAWNLRCVPAPVGWMSTS